MTDRPVFESLMGLGIDLANAGFCREALALEVPKCIFLALLKETSEWNKFAAGRRIRCPVNDPTFSLVAAAASSRLAYTYVEVFHEALEAGIVLQLPIGPLTVRLSADDLKQMRAEFAENAR